MFISKPKERLKLKEHTTHWKHDVSCCQSEWLKPVQSGHHLPTRQYDSAWEDVSFLVGFEKKRRTLLSIFFLLSSDWRHRLRDESAQLQSYSSQTSWCGFDWDPGISCSFTMASQNSLIFLSLCVCVVCERVRVRILCSNMSEWEGDGRALKEKEVWLCLLSWPRYRTELIQDESCKIRTLQNEPKWSWS